MSTSPIRWQSSPRLSLPSSESQMPLSDKSFPPQPPSAESSFRQTLRSSSHSIRALHSGPAHSHKSESRGLPVKCFARFVLAFDHFETLYLFREGFSHAK